MVMPFTWPEYHTWFLSILSLFLIAASSEKLQVTSLHCSSTVVVFWKAFWRATLQKWLPGITLASDKQHCHLLQYLAIHPLERLSQCICQSCQRSHCSLSRQISCKSSTMVCCSVVPLYATFPLVWNNLLINAEPLILRVCIS